MGMLRRYGPPAALVALVVIVYLNTLAPGVMPEDAGEFQTRYYTLEPAHPTGYPLLILLGKAWVSIWPLGSVAERANLLSLLLSAGAVLATYAAVFALTGQPVAAVLGGLGLAFTPSLWFYSTKAGPYPLHIFLLSLVWLMLIRWQQGQGRLYAPALVVGMGLAHHRMFVMSLPAMVLFVLLRDRGLLRRGRQLAVLSLLLVVPFISYLLLPLKGIWPLPRFLSHALLINSPMGKLAFPVRSAAAWWQRLRATVWPNLVAGVGPVGLLLSLSGFALLGFSSRWPRLRRSAGQQICAGLLLTLVAHLAFSASYAIVPDDRRYYVPVDFVLAIGTGLAVAWLLAWAGRIRRTALAWTWRSGVAILLVVLPVWQFQRHRPTSDQAHGEYVSTLTRQGLAAVETDATIITTPGFTTAYWYYQQVEGWRPDVTVHMDGVTIGEEGVLELLDAGQPVYFRQPLYGLDRAGSGYLWLPFEGGLDCALADAPAPEWTVEADHTFIPGIRLARAAASAASLVPDEPVLLWLDWEIDMLTRENLSLSLFLEGLDGRRWWTWDRAWHQIVESEATGSRVATTHYLVVPAGMPPGQYTWVAQLSGEGLEGEMRWEADVPVMRARAALPASRFPLSDPLPAPWRVGAVALLGIRLSEGTPQAGGYLFVTFLWQAIEAPGGDWQMQLRLEGGGREAGTSVEHLMPAFPTSQWLPGDTFLGLAAMRVPADWPAGRYSLSEQLHGPEGSVARSLGFVHVEERPVLRRAPRIAHPRRDELGASIRLLGYELEPRTLVPGEVLHLTLYWQSIETPAGNYKVFNHLVGTDGFLGGQADGLPGGSLVLTGEWVPGEVIIDRYEVVMEEDAPPGDYTLLTGMYRPDDGYRLPALDGNGEHWPNDAIVVDVIAVERP
jgi:hypothetical protein